MSMKLSNFLAGLQTLQPYYNDDEDQLAAEHDQFYVLRTDRPLTSEDQAKMRELGWWSDRDHEPYSKEAGWCCFL